MNKRIVEPNTTLYPVPVVLVTTGGAMPNVMTLNRIASCSAEPPRISIPVRSMRHSHAPIKASREFVVNIPAPEQQVLSDYISAVNGRVEDKFATTGLQLAPSAKVQTSLLKDCPVNVDFARAYGLVYQAGVVRERPTHNFRMAELRQAVKRDRV